MNAEMFYTVDATRVVSETLDQETIIIHLENGTYYSLNATASALWELIVAGHTYGALKQAFHEQYEGDVFAIEASLEEAIALFVREGLIREHQAESVEEVSVASEPIQKRVFVPLSIERYEDMQEMLLADPIHDVESAGWPHIKPTRTA